MKGVKDTADELRALREAIGLLSTLAPKMEVNPDDPLWMAQEIVAAVRTATEELREALAVASSEAVRQDHARARAVEDWHKEREAKSLWAQKYANDVGRLESEVERLKAAEKACSGVDHVRELQDLIDQKNRAYAQVDDLRDEVTFLRKRMQEAEQERDDWHQAATINNQTIGVLADQKDAALAEVERLKAEHADMVKALKVAVPWLAQREAIYDGIDYEHRFRTMIEIEDILDAEDWNDAKAKVAALRKRVEELEAEAHAGYLASAGKLLENHHQAIEQARREGAEEMREQAADMCEQQYVQAFDVADVIRALPIDPPKAQEKVLTLDHAYDNPYKNSNQDWCRRNMVEPGGPITGYIPCGKPEADHLAPGQQPLPVRQAEPGWTFLRFSGFKLYTAEEQRLHDAAYEQELRRELARELGREPEPTEPTVLVNYQDVYVAHTTAKRTDGVHFHVTSPLLASTFTADQSGMDVINLTLRNALLTLETFRTCACKVKEPCERHKQEEEEREEEE